jgi:oligopeptide/dipeptide ABC transporter ATP-binding protein
MNPILRVEELRTIFLSAVGVVRAVDGISFSVYPGEIFGLVGESGSGKSATCRSILRLIPSPPGRILSGTIRYGEKNLFELSESEMSEIRGVEIAMIFQDPMTALNPAMRIGNQIMEPLLEHQNVSSKEAKLRAVDLLKKVGVPAPEQRFRDYPHQFSGGMRQRVLIAIALACNPRILLADEPTTALDVTIQDQILKLILKLQKEYGISVLIVTHDLGVIAQTCDRVAVMYAGQILEIADTRDLFNDPRHPYTIALLDSIPKPESGIRRLKSIKGSPPDLSNPPSGCRFHPRCAHADSDCVQAEYELVEVHKSHFSACIKEKF